MPLYRTGRLRPVHLALALLLTLLASSALAQSGWTQLGLDAEDLSAVAAGQGGLLLAGGGPDDGNGMFRSTDGGASWTPINTGLGTIDRVEAIAIQPATTEGASPVLLIGVLKTGGPNLFRSTDLGDTWSDATTGLVSTTAVVKSIVFDPSAPLVAYAALNAGGVFKSLDGGQTWSDASSGLLTDCGGVPCALDVAIDPVTPSTLYAALPTDLEVYKTENGGMSWTTTSAGFSAERLALRPNDPDTVYCNGSLAGLIRSSNGGDTWDTLTGNPGLPSGGIYRALLAGPADLELWMVADDLDELVYRSLDGGDTWTETDTGLAGLLVRDFARWGDFVLAATDDGVYVFDTALFVDGFESGDTSQWSSTVGLP